MFSHFIGQYYINFLVVVTSFSNQPFWDHPPNRERSSGLRKWREGRAPPRLSSRSLTGLHIRRQLLKNLTILK